MKEYKKTPEEYREEAKKKALDFLSRYKFNTFGYWAAVWVQMNKLCRVKVPDPFFDLVELAKKLKEKQ